MDRIAKSPRIFNRSAPKIKQTKPRDAVYILGPRNDHHIEKLTQASKRAKIKGAFIGDGIGAVTEDMIFNARRRGLIGPQTDVFCLFHGRNQSGNHDIQVDPDFAIPTTQLVRWLREELEPDSTSPAMPLWEGTIHVVSCRAGVLREEIDPEDFLWRTGTVLLYASKQLLGFISCQESMAESIALIGYCKRSGKHPTGIEFLGNMLRNSGESNTVIGGKLLQPLIVRAPKRLDDAIPGKLHKLWEQRKDRRARAEFYMRVEGHDDDISQLMSQPSTNPLERKQRDFPKKLVDTVFVRVHRDKLKTVEEDLRQYPELVNCADDKGWTLLMEAATLGSVESLNILIKMHADVNAVDCSGTTALHVAACEPAWENVETLLRYGANPNAQDADGSTPIHYACESLDPIENCSILLDSGADIDLRDNCKFTPLYMALHNKNIDLAAFLIQRGADVNICSGKGHLPLQVAAELDNLEIAAKLLENGAEINAQSKDGNTALHEAAATGNLDMVGFLLENGANPRIKNKKKRTAESEAQYYRQFDVFEFFNKPRRKKSVNAI